MLRATPFALTLLLAARVVSAAPPASITMGEVIPFAPDVAGEVGLLADRGGNATDIKTKCDLPGALAQSIAAEARRKGIEVTLTDKPEDAQGPVLKIVIEGVLGFSGAWKGPKSLILRGELRDGETVLGSFFVREQVMKLFNNSCEEFDFAGKKAAVDIAKWLKAPQMRARLGSA